MSDEAKKKIETDVLKEVLLLVFNFQLQQKHGDFDPFVKDGDIEFYDSCKKIIRNFTSSCIRAYSRLDGYYFHIGPCHFFQKCRDARLIFTLTF